MLLTLNFLINVLTFLGVFLVVVATDSLFFDLRRHAKRNDESRAQARQIERNRRRIQEALSIGELSRLGIQPRKPNEKASSRQRLERIIDQAGNTISPGRFYSVVVFSAVSGAALAYLLSRNVLICLAASAVFVILPFGLLVRLRHQRKEKLLSQLSDAFRLMSRVMRSGQTASQAMQAVADELPPPVSHEFRYCSGRINLGMNPGVALREMANRTGLTELRIFVLAVMVHRSCGGNLVTLIDLLEHLVRERFRIRGVVRMVTAQGRTQSAILVTMPLLIFAALWVSNPEQSMKLLDHRWMIWTAAGLTLVGYLWVRRICHIEL